jgi:hypothetical protein
MGKERYNAGTRLVRIFKSAQNCTEGNAIEAWCKVLGIPGGHASTREREVVRRLTLLNAELDKVEHQVRDLDLDRDTYDSAFAHLRQAISFSLLMHAWGSGAKPHLSAEVMGVFALVVQFLPSEEDPIGAEELSELTVYVEGLRKRIRESATLSQPAKSFLVNQIDLVLTAFRDYPIRGAASFRQASLDAVAHWTQHSSDVAQFEDSAEVNEVKELWPRVTKYGKRLVLINGFVATILGTAKLSIEAVNVVRQLIPGHVEEVVDVGRDSTKNSSEEK